VVERSDCSGGAGARGTRGGQMTGRGGSRGGGSARGGGGPAARGGRGASASASMLPQAAQSYSAGYDYVSFCYCFNEFYGFVFCR